MRRYRWPGNVRELQRVIQEAVVRSEDAETIDTDQLPGRVVSAARPEQPAEPVATGAADWQRRRLIAELRVAVEAKRAITTYKGTQWKAEFMRLVYPHAKAQNAKGFADAINRLTKGPWGDPAARDDEEMDALLRELLS
jgi:transcriptional regulator of acetoin/glycerol metabolism